MGWSVRWLWHAQQLLRLVVKLPSLTARLWVRCARVRELPAEGDAPEGLERALAEEADSDGRVPLVQREEPPGVELEGGVGGPLRALQPLLDDADQGQGQARGALEVSDLFAGAARVVSGSFVGPPRHRLCCWLGQTPLKVDAPC